MANIPSLLNSLSSFLQNHQVSFTNGLLILCTLGGEQIFRSTAFRCPCHQPKAAVYSCSFIFGPALVLLVIGVLVNNLTWSICHGCCNRSENCEHGYFKSFQHCTAVLSRAFIAPVAWIFIIFLDGSYYVCLRSVLPCEKDSVENLRLLAESQIISWAILVCVVGVVAVAIFICRCIDSVTLMQYKYINIYREAEAQHLDEAMKIVAKGLAKTNVQKFVDHAEIKKVDWDAISKAPEHRVQLNEMLLGTAYTPLHQWCNNKPFLAEMQQQTAAHSV